MFYSGTYKSPIGTLTLASDGGGLVGLWIKQQKYYGSTLYGTTTARDDIPVLNATKQWLDRYFAGKRPAISELPLAPAGSAFRQGVWEILRSIPYGELSTYGDIAKQMAAKTGKSRMSAQAVGAAVGHNPLSIIVPCHRVVGANGNLTGYASGLEIKMKLLEGEGVDMTKLFVPQKGTAL